jgi:tyrosyl-tRNA synthetase
MGDGPPHVLDTLARRGFIHQMSDETALRKRLAAERVTFYTGFDPTGPSLTVGHLVPIMMMAHLQRAGHRPIVLCGGGTALVGDPSGKTSSRPILTRAEIDANLASQKQQLMRFLSFENDAALVVNNADWLCELNYIAFLRDIGRLFSVNQMLTADIYRTRLEQNLPLSFLEFNYQLLQAYDFLHLYREHGCVLQCAGSDQWANCLAGMDLIRKLEGAEAQVLCAPLLTTSSGAKMGKTEAGAVWLAADRTSPYEFYQYWRNADDRDVARWLKLFTFMTLEDIEAYTSVGGAALNNAKRRLAYEVTALVHGADEAKSAGEASGMVFGAGAAQSIASATAQGRVAAIGAASGVSLTTGTVWGVPSTTIARAELEAGLPLIALLHRTGLCASNGEAKRLIAQGGAYVNDAQVTDLAATVGLADVIDDAVLLRAGKKHYHRLRVI